MLKNSLLKTLIWLLPVSILPLLLITWSGAQTRRTSSRNSPLLDSGDYFYSPMQLDGEWGPYTETICSVDPSGRGSDETVAAYLSQRHGFLYLHINACIPRWIQRQYTLGHPQGM